MTTETPRKWVGARVKRKEDLRFIQGLGTYTDDLKVEGMLHAALVRSPYAHARILRIDASRALALPGVVAVLTGEDVTRMGQWTPNMLPQPFGSIKDYCLAVGKARYSGEAVAAIVAESKYLAEDAAELVDVEYDPLPPVVDTEKAAQSGSPLVHEELPSNQVWARDFEFGDVDGAFAEADQVVTARFGFHRFTSAPLENSVVIARYDAGRGELTIWSNNQRPMFNRRWIAAGLNLPEQRIHFICPDIGGGFGIKNDSYPYLVLVGLLAMKTGRPVKWVEDRTGHLQASTHGSEIAFTGEMAFRRDGTILGLRATALHDEGAFIRREPIGAINFLRHATVGYKFAHLRMELKAVVTTKCPVGPNRSYGKLEQCYLVERLIDMGARELGLDPVEVRRRNFVQPQEMPFETASGCVLDGGDYPRALEMVLKALDYDNLRREQEEARKEGRYIGIGIAMGMDGCPVNSAITRLVNDQSRASGDSEAAWVRIEEGGRIVATTGSVPQGQGHETVISQIAADELGVTPDDVYVTSGFDSYRDAFSAHSGTYASRFAIVGTGAVLGACAIVRDKVKRIAAHLMEADPATLELRDGAVVNQATGARLTLAEVAHAAWRNLSALPPDMDAGLFGYYVYRPPFEPPKGQGGNFSLTYSYGISGVVVEVDVETGKTTLRQIVHVDDAGNPINPLIVEGQVHGAIAHQAAAALYEHLRYDDEGQLLASSFKDYLAPTAEEFPHFDLQFCDTPSLFSPLGARGMGEGGGSPLIAVINGVDDALAPLGVEITDSHVTPDQIRQLLRDRGLVPVRRPG